jgi:hypothetical protein
MQRINHQWRKELCKVARVLHARRAMFRAEIPRGTFWLALAWRRGLGSVNMSVLTRTGSVNSL